MHKNIKILFFIQFGLVLLFPTLILMGVHFPFWGIIPALAIVSLVMAVKNLKKGLLRTSMIINNLSILLFPFFFTLISLLAFPPGFLGTLGGENCPVSPDLALKSFGVISSTLGLVIIPLTYLVTAIIITVLLIKDKTQKKDKK
jgi:hypothetical protein